MYLIFLDVDLSFLRYKHLKSENANEVTSSQASLNIQKLSGNNYSNFLKLNICITNIHTTINIFTTLQKQACCQLWNKTLTNSWDDVTSFAFSDFKCSYLKKERSTSRNIKCTYYTPHVQQICKISWRALGAL